MPHRRRSSHRPVASRLGRAGVRGVGARGAGVLGAGLLGAAVLVVGPPGVPGPPGVATARAASPERLATQVTDPTGALSAGRAGVDAALADLTARRGVQLWVVVVDTFDGQDAAAWADRTAVASGLGVDDVLLTVATGDRAYAYSVAGDSPLTDADLDAVDRATEARLADGDWAGAVEAGAAGLDDALAGTPWGTVLGVAGGGVVVLAGGGVLLHRRQRRRQVLAGPTPEFAGHPTEELRTRADAALVRADDAVRSSAQELQFASAEFGDEATAGFTTLLARARTELTAAFATRQALDDDQPETPAEEREALAAVIVRTRDLEALLAGAADAVDDLRDVVTRAPGLLDGLLARLPARRARVDPARAHVAALAAEFGDPAVASVADAPGTAADRLDLAGRAVATARAALGDASRSGEVVDAVRAAEASVDQAEGLLASVARTGEDLRAAVVELPVALARLRAAAGAAPPASLDGAPSDGAAAGYATAAAAARAVVQTLSATGPGAAGTRDPLGGLHRVVEAERALDAARAAVDTAVRERRGLTAALDQALVAARAETAAAEDYVAARRGAVGGAARTRLAEARRHLEAATAAAATDPAGALEHARTADALAERASAQARADVEAQVSRPSAGDDLGSVLGGIVLGGGRSRSGWGGGWSGGVGGGGFGGGFGGGGSGGGGFGGGSGGSGSGGGPRRSSGGSGGRRSRGGRF